MNIWICTPNTSIRCAVDRSNIYLVLMIKMCGSVPLLPPYGVQLTRSTVFCPAVKNMWSCTSTASIRYEVYRSICLVSRLRICGSVPILPPYGVLLTDQLYMVLRVRMCGTVLLMPQ